METIKLQHGIIEITDWELRGNYLCIRPSRELMYYEIYVSDELKEDIKRTGNPFCDAFIIKSIIRHENHKLFIDYCKEENNKYLKSGRPIIYTVIRPRFH